MKFRRANRLRGCEQHRREPTENIDQDISADQPGSSRAAGLITERDAGKQTSTGEPEDCSAGDATGLWRRKTNHRNEAAGGISAAAVPTRCRSQTAAVQFRFYCLSDFIAGTGDERNVCSSLHEIADGFTPRSPAHPKGGVGGVEPSTAWTGSQYGGEVAESEYSGCKFSRNANF